MNTTPRTAHKDVHVNGKYIETPSMTVRFDIQRSYDRPTEYAVLVSEKRNGLSTGYRHYGFTRKFDDGRWGVREMHGDYSRGSFETRADAGLHLASQVLA